MTNKEILNSTIIVSIGLILNCLIACTFDSKNIVFYTILTFILNSGVWISCFVMLKTNKK